MLSEELKSIQTALGTILGRTDPEGAAIVRICRRNLEAAIDTAKDFEENYVPFHEAMER